MSSIVYLRNSKTNTIYAYLNESVWDEAQRKNVYKRKCIGHLDPETGEIVPNRAAKKREHPTVKSRYLCEVLDKVSDNLKLTETLKLSFPDDWKKIMSAAYYLAATYGELIFSKQWSEQHKTPYNQVLTPNIMNEVLAGINSNAISLFFTLWRLRLQPAETYVSTASFGGLKYSLNAYSKDLELDIGDKSNKMQMDLFFSTKDNIPICYRLYNKETKRRIGDYDVYPESFSRLSSFMDEVEGDAFDPSLIAYAGSNITVRVRTDNDFVKGILGRASINMTKPENYRTLFGKPLFIQTFMQHISNKRFYTHIYFDPNKAVEDLSSLISLVNQCKYEIEMEEIIVEHIELYDRYLIITEDEKGGRKVELNSKAIMYDNAYFGYTVLISNTTRDPLVAMTPFMQNKAISNRFDAIRNEYDNTALNLFTETNYLSRIFIEFLALILRLEIENVMNAKKLNKIMSYKEMVSELNNIKTVSMPGMKKSHDTFISDMQLRILNAFDIHPDDI